MAPSTRESAPISSPRSLAKLWSSRSRSMAAVCSASSVSGRLTRRPARPRRAAPARRAASASEEPAVEAPPQRRACPRDWVTTNRAVSGRGPAAAADPRTAARVGDGRAPGRRRRRRVGDRARVAVARQVGAEPGLDPAPPATVNRWPATRSESSRASTTMPRRGCGPGPARAACRRPERRGSAGVHPIELVPEVPRAHDPAGAVLELQQVEAGGAHGRTGEVEHPADTTPHIVLSDTSYDVRAFAQVGHTIYAGGLFREVQDPRRRPIPSRTSSRSTARQGSYHRSTCRSTGRWAPIQATADGTALFIAGAFAKVNGITQQGDPEIRPGQQPDRPDLRADGHANGERRRARQRCRHHERETSRRA